MVILLGIEEQTSLITLNSTLYIFLYSAITRLRTLLFILTSNFIYFSIIVSLFTSIDFFIIFFKLRSFGMLWWRSGYMSWNISKNWLIEVTTCLKASLSYDEENLASSTKLLTFLLISIISFFERSAISTSLLLSIWFDIS